MRPDLEALAAMKPFRARAIAAIPDLIAYARQLERERDALAEALRRTVNAMYDEGHIETMPEDCPVIAEAIGHAEVTLAALDSESEP